jgi:hypothetical protein
MASYYNTTRGPLSFSLRSGAVGSAAPKKWTDIPDDEESSADILKLVRQKFLIRKLVPAFTPEAEPAPVVVEIAEAAVEESKESTEQFLSRKAAKRAARAAALAAPVEESSPSPSPSGSEVAESEEKGESITDA